MRISFTEIGKGDFSMYPKGCYLKVLYQEPRISILKVDDRGLITSL